MGKKFAEKTLTFSAGIFITLCIVEISLRLLGLAYQNNSSLAGKQKDENKFIVLCIGDSFVYGLGAPPEKSYPRQLQEMFDQANLSKQVVVVNTGMPGKNIEQIYRRFKTDIDAIHPDLVIFLGGAIGHTNLYGYAAFMEGATLKGKIEDGLYRIRTFQLLNYFAENLREKKIRDGMPAQRDDLPLDSPEAQEYCELGSRYFEAGKFKEAVDCLERSIRICPQRNLSYQFLGHINVINGNYAVAAECYEQWVKIPSSKPDPCFLLGQLYRDSLKDYRKAFIAYQQGVRRQPCRSRAVFNPSYSGLIHLYRNPGAQEIKGEIKVFLESIKDETNADYRKAIESLDTVDFHQSIDQWREKRVNDIIDLCRQRSVPVMLQDYPEMEIFTEVARARSVPFVHHSKIFAAIFARGEARTDYIACDNCHCNAKGYRVMAQNVYNEIMRMNLLR